MTEEEITRLKVSKDFDDGRNIYEVDFTVSSTGEEYDYEVSAEDGSILQVDKEMGKSSLNQAKGQGQNQTASENVEQQENQNAANQNQTQSQGTQTQAGVAVSQEEATKMALERVSGASAQDIRIQLEFDDGIQKYEGDIIYNGREYEFEIDANTGTFLEWSEERAD